MPSSLYSRWTSMKDRCLNPNRRTWKHYGGRGITICDRWLSSFAAFAADVGEPPDSEQRWSLDRIDNDRGYEPGNVRWALPHVQNATRRSTFRGRAISRLRKQGDIRSAEVLSSVGEAETEFSVALDEIATMLMRARIARGLSQKDLAGKLGVAVGTIERYEKNDYMTASLLTLFDAARVLGLIVTCHGAMAKLPDFLDLPARKKATAKR